jgi:hypothetical protein
VGFITGEFMLHEYDVVRLKKSIPSINLSNQNKGTILIVYEELGLPLAYEIESLDEKGQTIAILTLTEDEVELL